MEHTIDTDRQLNFRPLDLNEFEFGGVVGDMSKNVVSSLLTPPPDYNPFQEA